MKTLKKTEHGSGYDKYTTTYFIDAEAVQEALNKKIDFNSLDNEYPNNHYFAEVMAKLVAHRGQSSDVLFKAGLYMFEGRDGILTLAFEKLLWDLNHMDGDEENDDICTLKVSDSHGYYSDTLTIDDSLDFGYRLTLIEMAI